VSKKSIIFIISIITIVLIAKSYSTVQKNKEEKHNYESEDVIENDIYKEYKKLGQEDNIPDVIGGMKDNILFRINKDSAYVDASITVESAEILSEVKPEHTENENILKEIDNYCNKQYLNIFKEELRFVYVEFTVKNMSKTNSRLYMSDLLIIDAMDFGREADNVWAPVPLSFDYIEVKNGDENVELKDTVFDGKYIDFKSNEEYNVTGIAVCQPGVIGDLYLATNKDDTNTPNDQAAIKLEITLNESMECNPNDGDVSEFQKRDLKQLRINAGYTSYSYFKEQQKGFKISEESLYNKDAIVGKTFEQAGGEFVPIKQMSVQKAELKENLVELPEQFRTSKYIEDTLNLYMNELPYEKEQYRYLYIKVKIKELGNLNMTTPINNYLWLYNKDNENNMWIFGCADDYYITSSSNGNQTIEYQQIMMEHNEEIVVEAVYIVVPDTIYDLYLYTDAGALNADVVESEFYGAISLGISGYETNGIK